MEGNAGWERCTNPSRPLCNSSQGWTVNRWSLCVPMFVHQTVNQAALYTINAHRQWLLGQHCSPKVPSVGGLIYIGLWCPYRHQGPYWHTYTHSANILSVLEITPTQLYLVSRDNFFFPLPIPFCVHSLGSPPQCLTQCTCSWSQGHTGLSAEQPETRSQSQTPNYPQQSNIVHYAIMHQIRSGDETTRNQPMGRDQLCKILWFAKLGVYM